VAAEQARSAIAGEKAAQTVAVTSWRG
jgi:hypothetical protein